MGLRIADAENWEARMNTAGIPGFLDACVCGHLRDEHDRDAECCVTVDDERTLCPCIQFESVGDDLPLEPSE